MVKLNLRIKFILVFLLVAILPLVLFSPVNIFSLEHTLEESMYNDLTFIAESKEGQVYIYLDSIKSRTIDFSSDGEIKSLAIKILQSSGDQEQLYQEDLSKYLVDYKQVLDSSLLGINILDPNGVVIASTSVDELGLDESDDNYFIEGKNQTFLTNVLGQYSHFDEKNIFIVSTPIIDLDSGELIAVLVNYFGLQKLEDIISGEFQLDQGAPTGNVGELETFEVHLVGNNEQMFAGMHKSGPEFDHHVGTLPVQKCFEDNQEMVATYFNHRGVEVIGSSMCFPDQGWTLIVEVEAQEALMPIQNLIKNSLLILLSSIVLAVFIAFLFSFTVTKPVRELTESVDAISLGNFKTKIEKRLLDREDEFGELAVAFNRVLISLKLAVQKVGLTKEELKLGEIVKAKKEAERLRKEAERRYEVLTQSSPDCIQLFDMDKNIIFMNKSALEEHGLKSIDDVAEFDWMNTIDDLDKKKAEGTFDDALKGKVSTIEVKHIKTGSDRDWCLITFSPIADEKGKIVNVMLASRDISLLKRTEAQISAKTKQLERFASLAVGREEKMIQLKKRIAELEGKKFSRKSTLKRLKEMLEKRQGKRSVKSLEKKTAKKKKSIRKKRVKRKLTKKKAARSSSAKKKKGRMKK